MLTSTVPTGFVNDSTMSQSTFIIAVVVPVVVLLLAFGFILWLILKRGWLVRAHSTSTKHSAVVGDIDPYDDHIAAQASMRWDRGGATNSAAQLDGRGLPHHAAGVEIYQLHSDDSGRVAR